MYMNVSVKLEYKPDYKYNSNKKKSNKKLFKIMLHWFPIFANSENIVSGVAFQTFLPVPFWFQKKALFWRYFRSFFSSVSNEFSSFNVSDKLKFNLLKLRKEKLR